MGLIIRLENENDYREVENLTREAFWDVQRPGCVEHLIVHKIRKVPAFIPELDFVALEDGRIVGNIVYTRAKVVDEENNEHEVISFGPVSVLPSFQGRGIGAALIEHTIKIARRMGYKAIVIFGNPAYYHRFGFRNAEFYEDPVFQVDKDELEAFEKGFPYKEKHITDTQLK